MTIIPITGFGQVATGDVLLIKRGNEFVAPVTVKEVLNRGTDQEEIILSKRKNTYFIMSMFLNGTSWVKECQRIVNGRIYAISNSMNDFHNYNEEGPKP